MVQTGHDLERAGPDWKMPVSDRTCGRKGSLGRGLNSAGAGLGLGKERLDGLCRKWGHVTSQHSQEDEGGLEGVPGVGRSMLDQGSGGLELPLEEVCERRGHRRGGA